MSSMNVEDPSSGTTDLLLDQERQPTDRCTTPTQQQQQQQQQQRPPMSRDERHVDMVEHGRVNHDIVQSTATLVAHIFALSTLLVVYRWIYMLGGVSLKKGQAKLVFNWHPLLMTTAFCFMTVAALSFRSPWISLSRTRRKTVHGIGWLVAFMSAAIAMFAVFRSHNDKVSGYIANMYSFHSWMGACVLILYVFQFLLGAYSFWWSSSPALKAFVVKFHVLLGPLLYFSVSATILLGIQEKEGFIGCSYQVDSVNVFPEIGKIPDACLVSHTLGISVFLTMVFTFIALQRNSGIPIREPARDD